MDPNYICQTICLKEVADVIMKDYHALITVHVRIQNGQSHNPFTKFEEDHEENIAKINGDDDEESLDN